MADVKKVDEPNEKEKRPFEYRQVHTGFKQPLREYLAKRLQPWRWPIMLSSGAIRVEIGATAVNNLTLDSEIRPGATVVIDDVFGNTWRLLREEANRNFRDYVFCPQRAGNRFLTDQVRALLMEKTAQDIPPKIIDPENKQKPILLNNLYALIANLVWVADHPIRHLVLVSHASEDGEILMPMRTQKTKGGRPDPEDKELAGNITWESLQEALDLKERNPLLIHDVRYFVNGKKPVRNGDGTMDNRFPTTLPRPEHKNGKFVPFAVVIRGCSSGVHKILLNKMREALGFLVDIVVMPKFFEATARRGDEMFEYFQHDFEVVSKKLLSRAEVIAAMKAKKFRDWEGNLIADTEWEALVPKNVEGEQQSTPVKEMDVRVEGRDAALTLTTFFDAGDISISTQIMTQEDEPDEAAIRDHLIKGLTQKPFFKSGPKDWPIWLRMGLRNRQAFIDRYLYRLDPTRRSGPRHWAVQGHCHYYQIRTPVLKNGKLLADYHPGRAGGRTTRMIDLNDDVFFGRSDPPVKDPPESKVGDNFSRQL